MLTSKSESRWWGQRHQGPYLTNASSSGDLALTWRWKRNNYRERTYQRPLLSSKSMTVHSLLRFDLIPQCQIPDLSGPLCSRGTWKSFVTIPVLSVNQWMHIFGIHWELEFQIHPWIHSPYHSMLATFEVCFSTHFKDCQLKSTVRFLYVHCPIFHRMYYNTLFELKSFCAIHLFVQLLNTMTYEQLMLFWARPDNTRDGFQVTIIRVISCRKRGKKTYSTIPQLNSILGSISLPSGPTALDISKTERMHAAAIKIDASAK